MNIMALENFNFNINEKDNISWKPKFIDLLKEFSLTKIYLCFFFGNQLESPGVFSSSQNSNRNVKKNSIQLT